MRSRLMLSCLILTLTLFGADTAQAFCGFYVAKADTKIFNRASQVVLVRDGKRTVLTMVNDFQGDPSDFALVVPVPTFLERGQIHVGDAAVVDHLDAYTAPRLVEYHDPDPCRPPVVMEMMRSTASPARGDSAARRKSLGVTIEASYTVGEYDILILSAEQSDGLETWLRENDYQIPEGASEILGSYLKQGMRFFVAKVNIEERERLGFTKLRPLQIAYEHGRFMLPIRLGMVNANGPQELFVYALTRKGRVETTNYRTVRLPTGMDLPGLVANKFPDFYRDMFSEQTRKENSKVVFLEYAWDMSWCDPCAADPLSPDELRQLGVFWLDGEASNSPPTQPPVRPMPRRGGAAQDVFVTRLHVRYDAAHFPDDLQFQTTGDRSNFQGRFVMRHAFKGEMQCEAGKQYRSQLPARREAEAQSLASLTGWDIDEIRKEMEISGESSTGEGEASESAQDEENGEASWWDQLWGSD